MSMIDTATSTPCPISLVGEVDTDGWCSVHEWDCADLALHLTVEHTA